MSLKCRNCGKVRKDNYLGGIRDLSKWGKDKMICGTCYNKGVEE